jgi:phenylalanyl-tRNA synthetase alpha chain
VTNSESSPQPDLAALLEGLVAVEEAGRARLAGAQTVDALRLVTQEVLGKRSELAATNSQLRLLAVEDRPVLGQAVQQVRERLEVEADTRRAGLEAAERAARDRAEAMDLTEAAALAAAEATPLAATLPLPPLPGHRHLVTIVREELEDIFVGMGYQVAEGPEAETDWHNFEALNMPPNHPARGMFDTFYLNLGQPGSVVLRTHTSPVQIRLMETSAPPIYAVAPGRVYRRDTPDARHLAEFHQIEGLVVDRRISMGDLAGTIEAFTSAFFGPGRHSRLRPSFFPFTEPSAEFDVTCWVCAGEGCRTCSHSGWVELGGCGMVDPNVLQAVGIDPEQWSGFAFGFGIDRLAQARTDLSDMRALLDNDIRFISQF